MKHGKKYQDSAKLIQQTNYEPDEAIALALQTAKCKFDETIWSAASVVSSARRA